VLWDVNSIPPGPHPKVLRTTDDPIRNCGKFSGVRNKGWLRPPEIKGVGLLWEHHTPNNLP